MGYTSSRRKHVRNFLSNYKKRRCTNIISHFNNNASNHFNTSNNNNVIGTSNFPCSNVQNGASFNTLITLQKVIDKESSVSLND